MENIGFPEKDIQLVTTEMNELFDFVSTDEAEKRYCNSRYWATSGTSTWPEVWKRPKNGTRLYVPFFGSFTQKELYMDKEQKSNSAAEYEILGTKYSVTPDRKSVV